jgi:prepilin-type N-terminal cleavage/methylation domain-containing protein
MKRAFTLIELLVVIAIIAILAAILFPVFAQAKLAAKQAVNISNHKQLGLAVLMYTNDYDDYFPLEQRWEPSDTTFSGAEPWSVDVQPYIKNWGIFLHPLGPSIPSSPANLVAWRETQMYGAMAKAENTGLPYYQPVAGTGSFEYRVCGGQPCEYEGLFGNGCGPGTMQCSTNAPLGYGGSVNVPSYSTTGVANPANALLVAEGGMWDLWSQIAPNPCTYGVYWSPADLNVNGTTNEEMACPAARHNPLGQTVDPASTLSTCSPGNTCDGVINHGIQNGMSTYVATDGHATAQDYRGGVMAQATLSNGTVVIKSMWPAGGS